MTKQGEPDSSSPPGATLSDINPFNAREMYTINEICAVLKIGRKTWYRRVATGALPPPVKFQALGPRIPGAAMREWYRIESQAASAGAPHNRERREAEAKHLPA